MPPSGHIPKRHALYPMLRTVLLLIGLLVFGAVRSDTQAGPAPAEVVDFGQAMSNEPWTRPLDVLVEPKGEPWTMEQALQAGGWRTWVTNTPNDFLGPEPAWLRLNLRNSADGPVTRWFQIQYWWLPDVRAQVFDAEGKPLGPMMRGGTSVPVPQRAIRAAAPTFPVTLQAGQEAVLLIRAEGVVWWTDRLRLLDAQEAAASITRRAVAAALLLGMALMLALMMVARRSAAAVTLGLWVLSTTLSEVIYGGHLALLPWFDGWRVDMNALSSSLVLLSHALLAAMTFLVLQLGDVLWLRRIGVVTLLIALGASLLPWWTPAADLQDVEAFIYLSHAAGWLSLILAVWRGMKRENLAIAVVLALLHLNWLISYLDPHDIGGMLLSWPEVRISIKVTLAGLLALAYTLRDRFQLLRLQQSLQEAQRQQKESLEQLVTQRTEQLHRALVDASHANQAKSQFISSMSHELRTPMNAILGFSQMMTGDKQLDDRSREHAQEVLNAGEHLMVLIDDLLDLSKVELNRLDLAPTRVDLAPLVAACQRLVAPKAMAHDVSLLSDDFAGVAVQADVARLRQILINLMDNAVKYNRRGGWVRVEGEPAPLGMWRLVVADGGPGVSEEAQQKLFQPFERGDARHGNVQGTGIGLALSRRLAEMMGGRMGLESRPGSGSRFWVELPALATEPDSAPQPEPASQGGQGASEAAAELTRPHVVLCVDDNPINLKLMRRMLEREPLVEAVTCSDPQRVLTLVTELRPSTILMDINMPGLSGYDLLERLRQEPQFIGLPVVAVSADAMVDDVARGRLAGFSDYITKPLELNAFRAVLLRTLLEVERGGVR